MRDFRGTNLLITGILLFIMSGFIPAPCGAFLLQDSGQQSCYSGKGQYSQISCPAPGGTAAQDGSYNINPQSLSTYADGIVYDENTRLMWQAGDSGSAVLCGDSLIYCEGLTLGGFEDWRLPTKKELVSILHYGLYPTLSKLYFPVGSGLYHSSTISLSDRDIWFVQSLTGETMLNRCSDPNYITARCVRGDELVFHELTDNGSGTVYDIATGLTWQGGEGGLMSWSRALSYCEGLSYGGYGDWRLPNVKELESLADEARYNPSIDRGYFPNALAAMYWSSTTHEYMSDSGFTVDFLDAGIKHSLKSGMNNVRCVRGSREGQFDSREISVSPPGLGFGLLGDLTEVYRSLTVSNVGRDNLALGTIEPLSYPFSITSDGCSGLTLLPGGSCAMTIMFSPVEGVMSEDALVIPSDDADAPELSVTVAGSTSTFLPDTGMTTCRDGSGNEIACPLPGAPLAQDGSYSIHPPSYAANGDGTVTDNNTALIWQQEDDGGTYTWYEASGTYHKRYNRQSANYCGSLRTGGYSDWRLPHRDELNTIVLYGKKHDPAVFPEMRSDYWASEDSPGSVKRHVRCVRGDRIS